MHKIRILILDAQGGGMGAMVAKKIRSRLPDAELMAVGTNCAATENMKNAGVKAVASGENSVVVCSSRADIIIAPLGMVVANSMMGEVTARMAEAVSSSQAKRILIPFFSCDNIIVGVKDIGLSSLVDDAVEKAVEISRALCG